MNILILEDETMVARQLTRLVTEALEERAFTLHHACSLDEAQAFLQENAIDLLFLDLNLNGEDGFDLLSEMTSRSFQTIIASANVDQALRSYDYGVLDFVPKPFTLERVEKALARVNYVDTPADVGAGKAKLLGVKYLGSTEMLNVAEVAYIKAAGRYSEVFMQDGRVRLHEKRLKELLQVLPEHFHKIHKSYLANLTFAQSISSQEGSRYQLLLKDTTGLPIGRQHLVNLRERMC